MRTDTLTDIPTLNRAPARLASECLYPGLWDRLEAAYAPALGPQGLRLMDLGPRQRHGTLVTITGADYRPSRHPKLPWCLNFDATPEEVTFGDTNDFGTDDFSVVAWARVRAVVANGQGGIVTKYNGSTNPGWRLDVDASIAADPIRFSLCDTVGGAYTFCNSLVAVTDSLWHQWVGTADRDGLATLYRDGLVHNTASIAGVPGSVSNSVACRLAYLNFQQSIDGEIAAVYLYRRVLLPAEVQLLSRDPLALFRRRKPVLAALITPPVGGEVQGPLVGIGRLLGRGRLVA